ncbi:hypothetical protein O3G_MSEX003066 [Manduca sexta]|uniref:Fatty acyl-CoA reductase C-terminal domain-containing protein n=1 Tax=Manduca sexta TaxID=7130 RepID=A0A922CEI2_MANSE|nr:hypothetical protein O3G_MSEX003066 [Manduca sexta]
MVSGEKWMHQYPFTVALWYPGGNIRSYWITYQISKFFYHLLPAYLIDGLLFLLRRERFMVKLQARISHGLEVVQYYTTKEWHFNNERFLSLHTRINAEDQSTFYFVDPHMDMDHYFENFVLGIRQYCCKEDPGNLPRARRLHRIRYIVDRAVKLFFLTLLLLFFFSKRHYFLSYVEMLDNAFKSLSPFPIIRREDYLY